MESVLDKVFEKVCQQARGKAVESLDKSNTPLYTSRNSTLIRTFNIAAEVQQHMIAIIDDAGKARRAKERMAYIRRHKGMQKHRAPDVSSVQT